MPLNPMTIRIYGVDPSAKQPDTVEYTDALARGGAYQLNR